MTRRDEVLVKARRYVGEVGAVRAYDEAGQQTSSFWRAVQQVCKDGWRRADFCDRIVQGR